VPFPLCNHDTMNLCPPVDLAAGRRSRSRSVAVAGLLLALAALCPAPTARGAVVVEAWYALGENGAGTDQCPLDSSGNGRHFLTNANGAGVLLDAADPAPGSTTNYVFSGSQGFSGVGWDPPEDNVGAECWARAADLAQTAQVFGTGRISYGDGINIAFTTNGFCANFGGLGWDAWIGDPYLPCSTSEWVHLAAVRENGKARFYANGLQRGRYYDSTAPRDSTQPHLGAGHNLAQRFFRGAVDEARIFTFAAGAFEPGPDLLYYQASGPNAWPALHPKPYVLYPITHSFQQNAQDFVVMSGWQDLWYRFRGFLPTGAGVTAAQAESGVPSPTNFPDKTFVFFPPDAAPESHARTVGGIYYGSECYEDVKTLFERGYSTGITNIHAFTTTAFRSNVLRIVPFNVRDGSLPDWPGTRRDVLNISNTMGNGGEDNTIRALDYLIDRKNVLACTSFPGSTASNETLSGTLWNSLVVDKNMPETKNWFGALKENLDGHFRFKPDLVAASYVGGRVGGASSWSTPTVASGAAFLLEQARSGAATAAATNNYVLKAILMAGASKANLLTPVWSNGLVVAYDYDTPYVWSNALPAAPLDRQFGAGMFNVNNAYTILAAGEAAGSETNAGIGWVHGTGLASNDVDRYWFEVDRPEFCAMLVWNRHIQDNAGTSYFWSVSDLCLELRDADLQLLAASDAGGNNVEHIYFANGLPAGTYCLEVGSHSAEPENYGLAWRTVCPDAQPQAEQILAETNGAVRLAFDAVKAQQFHLERSTGLVDAAWTTIGAAVSDTNGTFAFTDPAPPGTAAFYRAVMHLH